MKYEILFDGSSIPVQSVCFGGLGGMTSEAIKSKRRSTARKETFLGIRVKIGYVEMGNPEAPTTPEKRQWIIDRHNEVMGRWTDGIIEYQLGKKKDGNVPMWAFYPINTPMYLFMASASFWRIHANYGKYHKVWTSLEPHERFQELTPLLKHFCVFGISQAHVGEPRVTSMPAPNSKLMQTAEIAIASNTGHAPWKNSLFTVNTMAHMHLIDQKYIVDNVPSFWDQLETTGTLSYNGRDDWWSAPRDFTPTKESGPCTHMIQGMKTVMPIKAKHSRSDYSSAYVVTPDQYLDCFSAMNNEVQRIVSDWT
jgi:hypothetical protein